MVYNKIRRLDSIFFDKRPKKIRIDTVVLHSMYNPNNLDKKYDIIECFQILNQHQVSCHYLIAKDGLVYNCVPEKLRAWHAGVSKMPFIDDQRQKVNDFSIGIELIGDATEPFSKMQYLNTAELIKKICYNNPISYIVSHQAIAPDRKKDPEQHFDLEFLKSCLPKNLKYAF